MSEEIAKAGITEVTVEAVITRADGTVENKGVVAHWKAAPDTVLDKLKKFVSRIK